MVSQVLREKDDNGISDEQLFQTLKSSIADCQNRLKRVLLVVPDHTRMHSNAGRIANIYYHLLKDTCEVELLEALGTHVAMTEAQCAAMYGDIPFERFIVHNWRTDVLKLGEVPGDYVSAVSEGLSDQPIDVEVNRRILEDYDLVLSIGQVVPHEVVGMANQSKNIFVGCGGSSMINSSHMLGAFYGMERMMGRDATPVRKVFDYAEQHFLGNVPLCYVLTVTTAPCGDIRMHGLYIGRERKYFEMAVAHAQQKNLTFVDRPLQKVIVYLDPKEFNSTWLGNKAIYRTRMAMADGGALIILAPGADKFGEDKAIDGLIRKYGYCGRERVIELCKTQEDLQRNLSAAAHLIHGSSDGRFTITYCTKHLTEQEVRSVCFDYLPYEEAVKRYDPIKLKDGYNTIDGEEIFYISNPALGLWADRKKFV
jgi:nickel-dependent lactate racemase